MNLFGKWIGYAGALAAVGAFSVVPTAACAQNYPTRPVKIIVATGPGGSRRRPDDSHLVPGNSR